MCVPGAFMCDTSALEALLLLFGLFRAPPITHIHTLVPIFSPVDSILSARCVSAPVPPPPLLILSLLPAPGVLVSAPDF